MNNAISQLLHITYPVIQGGMVWVSGWRLTSAVSNAGGLGLLGAGSMGTTLLEEHIIKTTRATSQPFGVNIPLFSSYGAEQIDLCIDKKVPIVFTSAGSPSLYTEKLKSHGIVVGHVVSTTYQAKKAERAGCDLVVAEGVEAGGHVGLQQITSIVLWPSVADGVQIPVVAAGGIVDGKSMAAAIALGAQGVQVGSRFAISVESSAHQAYKQVCANASESDAKLFYSKHMPTRAIINSYVRKALALENDGASKEEMEALRSKGRSKLGIFEGNLEEGELEIGQATGRITQIPTAKEILHQMIGEYETICQKMNPISIDRGTQ